MFLNFFAFEPKIFLKLFLSAKDVTLPKYLRKSEKYT